MGDRDKHPGNMSPEELLKYVSGGDFDSQHLEVGQLKWVYDGNYSVSEIVNKQSGASGESGWVEWLEDERRERIAEWGTDSIQEIENYWLPNPEIEPIIIGIRSNGLHEIFDGYHRLAIAVKDGMTSVPAVVGYE